MVNATQKTVGASLLAMAGYQLRQGRLTHRYREQARSHKDRLAE
jgi:hypothetical protein